MLSCEPYKQLDFTRAGCVYPGRGVFTLGRWTFTVDLTVRDNRAYIVTSDSPLPLNTELSLYSFTSPCTPRAALAVSMDVLFVQRTCASAVLPKLESDGAAGYDLCSAHYVEVPAGTRVLVPTGLKIQVPAGHYGRIICRPSLAILRGFSVGAEIIDSNYDREVMVLIFNHSNQSYLISPGERIALLVIEKISTPAVQEVESLDFLNPAADPTV